ncbi:MAG: hypothetical protein RKL32_22910, partial [Gammaproteobacteria bacterium]
MERDEQPSPGPVEATTAREVGARRGIVADLHEDIAAGHGLICICDGDGTRAQALAALATHEELGHVVHLPAPHPGALLDDLVAAVVPAASGLDARMARRELAVQLTRIAQNARPVALVDEAHTLLPEDIDLLLHFFPARHATLLLAGSGNPAIWFTGSGPGVAAFEAAVVYELGADREASAGSAQAASSDGNEAAAPWSPTPGEDTLPPQAIELFAEEDAGPPDPPADATAGRVEGNIDLPLDDDDAIRDDDDGERAGSGVPGAARGDGGGNAGERDPGEVADVAMTMTGEPSRGAVPAASIEPVADRAPPSLTASEESDQAPGHEVRDDSKYSHSAAPETFVPGAEVSPSKAPPQAPPPPGARVTPTTSPPPGARVTPATSPAAGAAPYVGDHSQAGRADDFTRPAVGTGMAAARLGGVQFARRNRRLALAAVAVIVVVTLWSRLPDDDHDAVAPASVPVAPPAATVEVPPRAVTPAPRERAAAGAANETTASSSGAEVRADEALAERSEATRASEPRATVPASDSGRPASATAGADDAAGTTPPDAATVDEEPPAPPAARVAPAPRIAARAPPA